MPTTLVSNSRFLLRAARASISRAAGPVAPRYGSSRFYTSTMHDNDPDVLDTEKARNLSKTQHRTSTPHEHAPGWNEHLASASEASVKADRSTATPEQMQEQTVDYVHSRHSPDDRVLPTQASYSKEEIGGPLGEGMVAKKVVETKTTEVLIPTESEEAVKADRKEV